MVSGRDPGMASLHLCVSAVKKFVIWWPPFPRDFAYASDMKTTISKITLLGAVASLLVASNTPTAAAQVYDLLTDWSDTQNPNGVWSYSGDVSKSTTANGEAFIQMSLGAATWTAPQAGTINITGAVWVLDDPYALWPNPTFWSLSINAQAITGGTFWLNSWGGSDYTFATPFDFSSGSGGAAALENIAVTEGDQLVLTYQGPASGVLFTIYFTPASADPVSAIEDLAVTVAALNLQNGIENSLDSKLDAALNAFVDASFSNDAAACNSLSAFINAVEAQRTKHITDAQADQLIAAAHEIRVMLDCGD
jgi:hypothetical protein